MNSDAAKVLVETITHALSIAIDSRNKITALERLIQKKNPTLFDEYTELLEKVRDRPPTQIFASGLEALHTKLIQD
jgi:hypothetical protein